MTNRCPRCKHGNEPDALQCIICGNLLDPAPQPKASSFTSNPDAPHSANTAPDSAPDAPSEKRPGCLIALLRALLQGGAGSTTAAPIAYTKRQYLFSKAERSYYEVLKQAVGSDYTIFAKVRLCDLIDPPRGKGRQSALNRISSKHVDFVLCDPATLRPILVIELDDSSHNTDRSKARDAFVDAALEAAGLPVMHQVCKKAYVLDDVRQQIRAS